MSESRLNFPGTSQILYKYIYKFYSIEIYHNANAKTSATGFWLVVLTRQMDGESLNL